MLKDEEKQPTPAEPGTFEGEDNLLDKITDDDAPADVIIDTPEDDEEDEDTQPEPSVDEPDYKEKFGASTRENQVLVGKLADMEARLGEVVKVEPPTESEIKAAYPEWDVMTDVEKRTATETLTLRKKLSSAMNLILGVADDLSFNKKFNEVINAKANDGSMVFPGLRERQEQFYEYCQKPTHKGASLQTLARAFLFEIKDELPKSRKTPPAKPSLARGGSGKSAPSSAPSDAGKTVLSAKDASVLRTKDPKRYMELMRTKKLVIRD